MSPIGRVFIIVNLVLAAAFIGFASTFLQKSTDYKALYEQEQAARATETGQLESANETLRDASRTAEQNLTRTSDLYAQEQTRNAALVAENQRLSAQLDTMEGNINLITAATQSTDQTVKELVTNAQDAYRMALAAQQEKDQAVTQQETAVADLRDAEFRISQRQDEIDALTAQVNELQKSVREQEILIDVARAQGFNTIGVQPDLRGVVSVVGANGRVATVSITENPGEAEITPGVSFAIHSNGRYKAEAVVTSVEGTFAFCRVEPAPAAPPIAVGDRATTRTDF